MDVGYACAQLCPVTSNGEKMKELDIGTIVEYNSKKFIVVYSSQWLFEGVVRDACLDCCIRKKDESAIFCAEVLDEIFGTERRGCGGLLGSYKVFAPYTAEETSDE